MNTISLRPSRELLKRTTTRCPVCRLAVPGEVWREGVRPAQVFLRRVCPEHGGSSACLASDARFYWLAKGDEANGCCQAGIGERGARSDLEDPTSPSLVTRLSSPSACCTAEGTTAGTLGRNADGRGEGPFETLSARLMPSRSPISSAGSRTSSRARAAWRSSNSPAASRRCIRSSSSYWRGRRRIRRSTTSW